MQGEPAHLQRLSVEGGAQDTQHARAEACPAKYIYPSDCVGSDVWMAQQVRPALPDPAYRTDRQQVVNVLRRKSAESIKARRPECPLSDRHLKWGLVTRSLLYGRLRVSCAC